jgi:hypothetical protein
MLLVGTIISNLYRHCNYCLCLNADNRYVSRIHCITTTGYVHDCLLVPSTGVELLVSFSSKLDADNTRARQTGTSMVFPARTPSSWHIRCCCTQE